MDSSEHHEPQRLSALYQYHNAPEVAPAHGLEYDDTIYPASDKYPVISERLYDLKRGKYGFAEDSRPPRIIFGMKVRTFLVVALVMVVVVVGAAVGGAVGGQQLRDNQQDQFSTTGSTGTSSSTIPTTTFSAVTPTYTPLSDCPQSNGTSYTSSFTQNTNTAQAANAGLHFTKYCDLSSPLSSTGASRIAEAFVYSFSDCVEVCAGYNYWNNGSDCTVAVYQAAGSRPGNCWVGHAENFTIQSLATTQGTDVAVLFES